MKRATQLGDATRAVHAGEDRHGQAAPLTTPMRRLRCLWFPAWTTFANTRGRPRRLPVLAIRQPYGEGSRGQDRGPGRGGGRVVTSSGISAEMVAALGVPRRRRTGMPAGRVWRDHEAVRRGAVALRHQDALRALRRPEEPGALFQPQNPHAVCGDTHQPNIALCRPEGLARCRAGARSAS